MTERTGDPGSVPGLCGTSDESGALTLEAVPHPTGPVLLHATGDIDTVTAPFLSEQLNAWFAAAPRVVLDLSGVSFLGSAGLSVLVASELDADDARVEFQLVCGCAHGVRRVLQVTGAMERLDVLDPLPAEGSGPGGRPPLFAVPDDPANVRPRVDPDGPGTGR